jgi:hypothetical protein
MLYELNDNAFNGYTYLAFVPNTCIYEELKKYSSIEEVIMKYINNIVLPKYKEEKDNDNTYDLIGKFALTNEWKTIEVKENDK